MSVGGVGSADISAVANATATAEAAAGPAPEVAALPPAPPPVADAFAPPPSPEIAIPDLGDVAAPSSAAYRDFIAAKQDLRQAKQEPSGTGHRRADIRQARQEVRAAKAALNAETSGAGSSLLKDTFGSATQAPVNLDGSSATPPAIGGNAVDTAALKNGAPADLGAQKGQALGHDLPAISQLHPRGEDGGYTNGDMNCAPAALAMIARGHPGATLDGNPVSSLSDAALINAIGRHADTNNQGTSPNGIIAAAQDLGLQTDAREGGFDQGFYDSVLAQGGSVMANGAYDIGGQLAGHFVTVTAKNQDGTYVVNDPLQGRVVWTADELDRFLRSNPTNGGVSISVV